MPKSTDNYNWKKIALIVTIITAVGGSITALAKGAVAIDNRYIIKDEANDILDKRYLQVSSYEATQLKRQISEMSNKIFKLDFKVNKGIATPLEKALLNRYIDQLQALRKSQ